MSHHDNHGTDDKWRVDVRLTREGDATVATADLFVDNKIYEAHGRTGADGFDGTVARELAVARALSALAHQLVDDASRHLSHVAQELSDMADEAASALAEVDA